MINAPNILCKIGRDIFLKTFVERIPPAKPPIRYGEARVKSIPPLKAYIIDDIIENGSTTDTEVAKASLCFNFPKDINIGTKNSPPPAPKKPFAKPAIAPADKKISFFLFSNGFAPIPFLIIIG